jgi:hypothetical protein
MSFFGRVNVTASSENGRPRTCTTDHAVAGDTTMAGGARCSPGLRIIHTPFVTVRLPPLSSNACSASSMLARCDSGVSRTTASTCRRRCSTPITDSTAAVHVGGKRITSAVVARILASMALEPSSPSGTMPNDEARVLLLANVRTTLVPLTGVSETLKIARDNRVGVGARLGPESRSETTCQTGSSVPVPVSTRERSRRSS